MKMYLKKKCEPGDKTVNKYRPNDEKEFGNSQKDFLKKYYKYALELKEKYGDNKWRVGKYQRNKNNGKGPDGNSRCKKIPEIKNSLGRLNNRLDTTEKCSELEDMFI